MKIAGIQCDLLWEDPEGNIARLGPRVEAAATAGAELVVLPEMFTTGFSMAPERVAEDVDGIGQRFLMEMADRHGVAVIGSVAKKPVDGGKPQNVAFLATRDGQRFRYAKVHPFTFGGEAKAYAAGTLALTVPVEGARVSITICYDLRFPELYAALAPRTDLFCVIANWPRERRDHWSALLKARAIECQAYVLGVNRVGAGGGLHYVGDSALFGPSGEVVAAAREGVEEILLTDVDPARVAAAREAFPVLGDRRPEVYRAIS